MRGVRHDHELAGLAPDNLSAWLATLGVLHALDMSAPDWRVTVCWRGLPLRPVISVPTADRRRLVDTIADGLNLLRPAFDFARRKDVGFSPAEFAAEVHRVQRLELDVRVRRFALRLRGVIASDVITKRSDATVVDPTAFCLLFGQGWQHFIERLERVGTAPADAEALDDALFASWRYGVEGDAFRWDFMEDRRYALLAGDPSTLKLGTVPGANRLAVVGLASHAGVPVGRRLRSVGTESNARRRVTYRWPLPTMPVELAALERLLMVAELLVPVARAERISNGKFMNVSSARIDGG